MSGAQTSTFADPNVLLNTLSGATTTNVVRNQLMNTEAQQNIASADMEQVSRAANWIDTLPAEQKPQAYQAARAQLQSAGFAKNAPAEYPGDQAITMLARQGLTVPQQYTLGVTTPPGTTAAINAALTPPSGQGGQPPAQGGNPPAQGSPPPGSGSPSLTGDLETDRKIIVQRESGGDPTKLNYVAQADPTAYARGATASGKYQFVNSTWQDGMKLAGLDPSKYPTAMSAPESVQDQVFTAVYKRDGTKPWDASTYKQNWVRGPGGQYSLQPVATAPPTAATPGGVAARTGGVDVAGPGAPPAAPAAPQFTYPNGKVGGAPDPTGLVRYNDGTAGTPPAGTPVPVAAATPAAPVVAQSGQPPATAQPPAQPAGPQANLPHASQVPTGTSSPQYQQAMDLQRRAMILDAQPDPTGRLKTLAAGLRSQAQLILQSDSVVQTQEGQVHVLTGQIGDPSKPLPHYVYSPDAGGPGIPGYIDTTGTNKPEINPARRMNVRPDGSVINDQGQVIAPAMPGATPPLGSFEVQKGDYEADRKLLPEIATQGQNAQTAQVRLQTMLDLLPKISTGAGGYTRTQLANLAETAGFPGIAQALIAHNSEGDAAAAQEFGKLTLAAAGAAERGDLGSRGSLGALKLYQQNNPSLDLRPGANKAMIGMQLIAAQADTDYSQAALAYANQHQNDFRTGKAPYQPLANFDLQWQQQRNPTVYAAAMGALNGQPPETWTKGLSDDEYKRALDIVSRASPSAKVHGKSGWISMQPNAPPPPPPGFKLVQ